MKKERYEALKRMAAPGSGASDNESTNANNLLKEVEVKEVPRIKVRKGISGSSISVRRLDGRGACTIMLPMPEAVALRFARQGLRMKLNVSEEELICRNLG